MALFQLFRLGGDADVDNIDRDNKNKEHTFQRNVENATTSTEVFFSQNEKQIFISDNADVEERPVTGRHQRRRDQRARGEGVPPGGRLRVKELYVRRVRSCHQGGIGKQGRQCYYHCSTNLKLV